ncbi:hypothetical protein EET67_06740 [Pseudaminobacter arsenicus]|uniref:MBOAT family protein n=1 Tax=Borborobacter arsenicus TaxID=1851146 RepID=A0A432V824_9HYPH|nr:MBOAT family O-acyltransferase [Pseudaminobacter arsenicus]RUM98331.1 hypothetical protein EET67_06740 [Pseudaminobacter arsenicus]
MNRLATLLLIAVLGAALFSLLSLDRPIDLSMEIHRPLSTGDSIGGVDKEIVSLPLSSPVRLRAEDSESLRLSLQSQGFDHVGVIALTFDGPPIQVINRTASHFETRTICRPSVQDGANRCRLVLRVGNEQETVLLIQPTSDTSYIEQVTFEAATAKRHAAASGEKVLYGFLLLTLLGPVLVWLRRWPKVESVALVALGTAWIATTGIVGLTIAVAFVAGGYISVKWIARVTEKRSRALVAALVGVIAIISFVKFVAPQISAAFANPGGFWLALPLGVSYFAIRIVDLMLNAYGGTLKDLNFRNYLAFMLLPHTLAAGPILTYPDFLRSQISSYSLIDFSAGAARVCIGLVKKLLADAFLLPIVAASMDEFLIAGWGSSPKVVATMLLANVAYVYIDFSAYCDLAIGAGRTAGRRIPENFDWPLVRSGIRQYWRHWHITLSQWVMRRVYLPAFLKSRSLVLSMVTSMMVIGLWHALNLPWALWAFHHGLAMAAEGWLFPSTGKPAMQITRSPARRIGSWISYGFGVVFVWLWVALGHSFTLFASVEVALRSYILALSTPIWLIHRAVTSIFL